jgi:hypothetical protein
VSVPHAQQPLASLHSMAMRECSEAASSVIWSVLAEDVMLGFSTQLLHVCADRERREGGCFSEPLRCAVRQTASHTE